MDLDVYDKGMEIRYSSEYARQDQCQFRGAETPREIIVRTYRKRCGGRDPVCGTGVTASALACYLR